MKALSIKQPWAWLICAGYKDIENRNWRIGRNPRHGPYSSRDMADFVIPLPSRVYIHTGKQFDDDAILDLKPSVVMILSQHRPFSQGAIIGEVTIVDCVTKSDSPWFVGPYGFVLKDAQLYDNPIPMKGRLGFFNVQLPEQAEKPKEG